MTTWANFAFERDNQRLAEAREPIREGAAQLRPPVSGEGRAAGTGSRAGERSPLDAGRRRLDADGGEGESVINAPLTITPFTESAPRIVRREINRS
jgi:hypothetical protein